MSIFNSVLGTDIKPLTEGGTGADNAADARDNLGVYSTSEVDALIDTYQPLDADLAAIAALSPSNDDFIQRKAGAWTNRTISQVKTDLSLSGTNSGDQTITLTGDATGSGTGSFAITLATINGNVGSFGAADQTLTVTADAKGRITAISATNIAIAQSQVSGLTAALFSKEPTISTGTAAQYWRGDKTWQTLNQAAVAGLTATDSPTFNSPSVTALTVGSVGTFKTLFSDYLYAEFVTGFGVKKAGGIGDVLFVDEEEFISTVPIYSRISMNDQSGLNGYLLSLTSFTGSESGIKHQATLDGAELRGKNGIVFTGGVDGATEYARLTSTGLTLLNQLTLTRADTSALSLVMNQNNATRAYSGLNLQRAGSEKWFLGMNNADDDFIIRRSATSDDLTIETGTGNVGFWGGSYGGGQKVLFVANRTAAPTSNPVGGGLQYAESGAGKWRGSSGTITTFGPAKPHCPVCESDFGWEWHNEIYGGCLRICAQCLTNELGPRPYIRWNEPDDDEEQT